MRVDFTTEQQQIRDSVARRCAEFGDQYWLERDSDGRFPEEFCKAVADHGYMGIAMPVTPHLILCYIAERVLGLPKSY